jgi:hypothetical protein
VLKRVRVSVSQLCEQLEIDPKKFRHIELALNDNDRTQEVRIVIEEPDDDANLRRVSATR